MKPSRRAGTVVLALALALAAPLVLSRYQMTIATTTGIYAVFALALSLPMKHCGLPSLGHAAFFGLGSYAVGLLTAHGITSMGVSIVAAVLASTFFAAVIGPILLRTRADYFLMATLAVGQVLFNVTQSFTSVTGGENGISGMTPETLFGIDFTDRTNFYYLSLFALVVVAVIVGALTNAPFGHLLRAGRDSATRTGVLGVDVYRLNLIALLWSAALAGLAGSLAAYQSGFTTPEVFSVATSATAFLMVAVGGSAFVAGPIMGAVIVEGLSGLLAVYTHRTNLVLGIIYIVVGLQLWQLATRTQVGNRWKTRLTTLLRRSAEGPPRYGGGASDATEDSEDGRERRDEPMSTGRHSR